MDFDRVEGAKSSGEMSMSAMIYFLRPVGQVLVFFQTFWRDDNRVSFKFRKIFYEHDFILILLC